MRLRTIPRRCIGVWHRGLVMMIDAASLSRLAAIGTSQVQGGARWEQAL